MKPDRLTERRKGTYALVLELAEETCLRVGKLGTFPLPRGFYLYAGSARGGLEARIKRHMLRHKPLRWHIDYLRQVTDFLEAWWSAEDWVRECDWYDAACQLLEASVPVKGFGSSDCRCVSHLVHLPSRPRVEALRRKLPEARISRGRVTVMELGGPQNR